MALNLTWLSGPLQVKPYDEATCRFVIYVYAYMILFAFNSSTNSTVLRQRSLQHLSELVFDPRSNLMMPLDSPSITSYYCLIVATYLFLIVYIRSYRHLKKFSLSLITVPRHSPPPTPTPHPHTRTPVTRTFFSQNRIASSLGSREGSHQNKFGWWNTFWDNRHTGRQISCTHGNITKKLFSRAGGILQTA